MDSPVTVVGSYLSPYVRKVLVCLDLKGIPYRIDPIIPFYGGDGFAAVSPVRRIPALMDDAVTLCDSTVICEYLEERHPTPALFPAGAAARARARWLEEYADTRMGQVLIWRLFDQLVISRFVWGERADPAEVDRTRTEEIPTLLDYLEGQVPEAGFLFGDLTVADVALGAPFRNAQLVRYAVAPERWPRTAAYVTRVLDHPAFQRLRPFEDLCMETPIPQHREALQAAGAPLTETTLGVARPRRGVKAT